MEELHDTRHWGKKPYGSAVFARSAYDDFFGGPPRHTAPFPVRFEDYCEIFGTADSASSIPALDLPQTDEGFEAASDGDRRGGVDYSEIFEGLGGGGFTGSYEELFAGSKRSVVSSLDGRARWGVSSEQQANEVSEHILEGYLEDHFANLEMDQVSSSLTHSDDVSSKQFSMSYHKTSRGIVGDVISEKTHTAKLDAIPGFTIVVDASDPVLEMKNQEVNKGITNSIGTKRYIHDGGQENAAQSNSSSSVDNYENLKADQTPSESNCASLLDALENQKHHSNSSSSADNYENLKANQTPSESNCASLLDAPENQKHHSRSSSYHSASSGDISLSDVEFLKVSEISLQTKPLQGPPPSRPPPQLIKKPEHPEMLHADFRSDIEEGSLLKPKVKYQMHSRNGATKIHAIDESMKDNSCCYDNEMDPSSAAAASVAAIKVAMEQAQARIKSAKELMERKRDKYKRNVGQPKSMTCEEDGASYEVAIKSSSNVIAANNLLKENNLINEYTFLEREETKNASATNLNHEEKKGRFPSSGKDKQQVRQDNGFKSTEVTCEFDEISGERKTENKYCELIRNDSLLNRVKDIYMQENENKAKAAMHGCRGIEKVSKKGEQVFEVEGNQQSSEASCSVEKLENNNNLKCASIAYKNDAKKNLVRAVMDDFQLTDSASELKEAYGFHLLDDTKKAGDVQESNTTDDGFHSVVGSCLCKDSEKVVQDSNSSFKLGVDNDFFKEMEFNAAKGIFGNVGNKREFNFSRVNFELNKIHKGFKVANEVVFKGRSDKEIRRPDELCINNTTDKMELAEDTKQFNEYEKETESMKHQYTSDVNRCKFEENNNAADKDEDDGLQTNEEACILTENEPEQEAIHDANGLENGKRRREARTKLQEDESLGAHTNQELQNFEFLAEAERDCSEKASESTSEVPVPCNLGKNQISSISAKEVCQQGENESDAPEVILSGKEGHSPAKAPDTIEVPHAKVAENHNHSIHNEEEENKRLMDMEKKRDKEWAIRVEEKERERQRAKDRIAMEMANYEARHQALTEARERAERIAVEEKERERQRAKDRIAMEMANYEARHRALTEARERAERIAVERVTAEARQRALAEALEKAEKAAEAEKASREARLRAERSAVERATEEARQRAIEKALAEKAATEARSRMRKGNATVHFTAAPVKEDSDTRFKSSSEILRNTQSQSAACSTNGRRYSDSCDNGGSESKLRCKARQERQQRTAERAVKALTEKNLRDIIAQREQAERDRLAESLDAEVRRWSSGKDGNLRALLSTLQYILGPDSGWQPIPLTDVLTAAGVKKAYRKATLCVHPDKLQQRGATIQQKYICEKVFDLLKDAWNKFNSEER